MNSDSKILKVITPKPKGTPSALAADLATAQGRLEDAKAAFEADRRSVIERGVQRVHELEALAAEIEDERAQVKSVVDTAGVL